MKILVVSDKVNHYLYSEGIKQCCKEVNFILSCGDLPFDYLEYIVTMLNKPLFYVFGNHDTYLMHHHNQIQTNPHGCDNIHQKIVQYQGVIIAGLQGSMRYNHKLYQYSEWEMQRQIWRMYPRFHWNEWRHKRALDILVTHASPFGIHDGTDRCHQGFKSFNKLMQRFKPRYLIHGHTHADVYPSATFRFGETEVISIFGYKILEIDHNGFVSSSG
jgi:Icc-related predicted phosphoesterase